MRHRRGLRHHSKESQRNQPHDTRIHQAPHGKGQRSQKRSVVFSRTPSRIHQSLNPPSSLRKKIYTSNRVQKTNYPKPVEMSEPVPVEIAQTNGQVAEVRIVCDRCRRLIGISLMPVAEAKIKMKSGAVCEQCREKKTSKKNRST
jgi:hypothetical protein